MAQHDYSKKEVLDIVEQVARQKGIPVDDFMRFAHIETGGTFNERAHNTSTGGAKNRPVNTFPLSVRICSGTP